MADGATRNCLPWGAATTIKIARLVSGAGDAAGLLGLSKPAFQDLETLASPVKV